MHNVELLLKGWEIGWMFHIVTKCIFIHFWTQRLCSFLLLYLTGLKDVDEQWAYQIHHLSMIQFRTSIARSGQQPRHAAFSMPRSCSIVIRGSLYPHHISCISVNFCSKETGRCFTIMKSFSIVFVYWTICMPECFGTYCSMLVHFKPVGAFSQPDVIDFVQQFIR
jgi:hypothetical protein